MAKIYSDVTNMGLRDLFKKKEEPAAVGFPATLGAPAKGMFVTMDKIPDGVFSSDVLEPCCVVEPEEGKEYAPIDGEISQLADTLHAVGIAASGMEILIHVGVDTVDMNGEGFLNAVKLGRGVKKGNLLVTVDLKKVHEAGHPTTVIMAVTNGDDFTFCGRSCRWPGSARKQCIAG